jgi:uncharacterized protein
MTPPNHKKADRPLTVNEAKDMLHKITENLNSRQHQLTQLLDIRRDYNHEAGYPETHELTIEKYQQMYDREGVSTRVVEVFPMESWLVEPTVFETEDNETNTAFEIAWKDLAKDFTENSWYEDSEGNPIWEYLMRADIQSGIGSFGTLLLGIDDGLELHEEATPKKGQKLTFLRPFSQALSSVTNYEQDATNPRYGQPTEYNLSFQNLLNQAEPTSGQDQSVKRVHWTRLIHLADNLQSSEQFGVPRQRPVFNYLMNLLKLYAGSAEMYWKGAFPGYSIETHPSMPGEVDIDTSSIKDQMEQMMNTLQRYGSFQDVTLKDHAPQVVDPSPQIMVQIEAICIRLGIPKRIFLGSERGELASSQDTLAWNRRITARQSKYITPRIIVPFVDRLIWLGILPTPKAYNIVWPTLGLLSPEEESNVALKRTESIAKYVGGGVETLIHPHDYLTKVLNFTIEEATEIIDSAWEAAEKEEQMTIAAQPEVVEVAAPLPGQAGVTPADKLKEQQKSKPVAAGGKPKRKKEESPEIKGESNDTKSKGKVS